MRSLLLLCLVCLLSSSLAAATAHAAGPRIIDDGSGHEPAAPPSPPSRPQPPPESVPPSSEATEPRLPWGYRRHDGVFFRMLAVVELWNALEGDVELTALGVPVVSGSLEVGYAFFEGVILNAELIFHGGPGIGLAVDGEETTDIEASMFGAGLGAGLNYYFVPDNYYLGVSGGVATLFFVDDSTGASGTTEPGFYLALKSGYEWWMTTNWAVGIGGRFVYMNLPDDAHTLHNLGVGLGLSATYN